MELGLHQSHRRFGWDAELGQGWPIDASRASGFFANLPHSVARSATFPASCAECRCIMCELETVFGISTRLRLGMPLGKVDEWLWIFHLIGSSSQRSYYWLRWLFCFLSARTLIGPSIRALLWAMQNHAAKTHLCTRQPPANNQRAQSPGPKLRGGLC